MDKKAFGKRLKKARNDLKLTAAKLSELCDIDDTHIRHMEAGKGSPSLDLLVIMCNILSVSPNYLLQDSIGETEISELALLSELTKDLTSSQLVMVKDVVAALVAHLDNII